MAKSGSPLHTWFIFHSDFLLVFACHRPSQQETRKKTDYKQVIASSLQGDEVTLLNFLLHFLHTVYHFKLKTPLFYKRRCLCWFRCLHQPGNYHSLNYNVRSWLEVAHSSNSCCTRKRKCMMLAIKPFNRLGVKSVIEFSVVGIFACFAVFVWTPLAG